MIDTLLETYITQYSEQESEGMKILHDYTLAYGKGMRMLSGPLQGAFLTAMSYLKSPQNILEIGTFTGYSALCLAQGLKPDGKLITIDIDNQHEEKAQEVWSKDEKGRQIELLIGNAAEIIPTLEMSFDLVFIDANKGGYETYFDLVLPKMPSGGVILADNVLFRSEVLLPTDEQGKTARYMDAFNQKIAADNRVIQVVLPLRDGISIIVKK